MSTTAQAIDKQRELMIAATWETDSNTDPGYHAFIQVMSYRKEIALRYLNESNPIARDELKQIFETCNQNIREILGV